MFKKYLIAIQHTQCFYTVYSSQLFNHMKVILLCLFQISIR